MPFENVAGASYLRLRGLPFSSQEKDVVEFIQRPGEVTEDHILIGLNGAGRPSGEAWVQFLNPASPEEVRTTKDKAQLGNRYVEIFPSCYEDCKFTLNILAGGGPQVLQGPPGSGYIRLRGLPFRATVEEVANFFDDFDTQPHQVALGIEGATGRSSGEAWVMFPNEEIAAQAQKAKDKQNLGGRYIEIFPSTEEEASRAASRPTQYSWYRTLSWYGGKGYGKGSWGGGGPNLPRQNVNAESLVGEVVEWKGAFGWIKPLTEFDHPMASRRQGRIYVHKQDLIDVEELSLGQQVQFLVYQDSSGLGAQQVRVGQAGSL